MQSTPQQEGRSRGVLGPSRDRRSARDPPPRKWHRTGSIRARKSVRARAVAAIANLGYGFDVYAVCVRCGFDEVELTVQRRGTRLEIEGAGRHAVPGSIERNTAGVSLARLMRDHGLECPLRIR